MIQRIQSIYLLLAAVLIGLTFITPFAYITADASLADEMWLYGYVDTVAHHVSNTWVSLILATLSIIAAIVTIFLYKRRALQVAMTHFVMACILLLMLACAVTLYLQLRVDDGSSFQPGLAALFPPLALVSAWLARCGIRKDEKLIRDTEHFR